MSDYHGCHELDLQVCDLVCDIHPNHEGLPWGGSSSIHEECGQALESFMDDCEWSWSAISQVLLVRAIQAVGVWLELLYKFASPN